MTSPDPALVDAILAADYPPDLGEQLLAADRTTVQAVLDVLDAERRETLPAAGGVRTCPRMP
ncbi:hypothetical protein AB0O22_12825 [Streptomyces sp. NPDC091204]|uniref:hypothetical protein n=1 Tax=Streptomyces sp. NPDC091204 TaxID=3155299 RepID=UPI00343FEAF3